MDCSPLGSPIHGMFQARTLEWVAISFSRESSWPRDWTQVSCTVGRSISFLFAGKIKAPNFTVSPNSGTGFLGQHKEEGISLLAETESEIHSVRYDSLWPHGPYSPWYSPGQNTGVGSLSLLQGIFPTQELNPGRKLYSLSSQWEVLIPSCRFSKFPESPPPILGPD